jgi:diacylglycerol kinase family enzyme
VRYRRHANAEPDSQVDWFLCSVNLGMGASIADGSNSGLRRYLGDTLGTFVSLVKTASRFEPGDVTGTVDGRVEVLNRVMNVTIGKNPHIASGIRLGVEMEPDDGSLYLFAVRNFTFFGLMAQAKRLYGGTFQDHPNNYLRRITSCSVKEFEGASRVEFDGDARGYLPCSVRVLKKTLDLIVPSVGHPNGAE